MDTGEQVENGELEADAEPLENEPISLPEDGVKEMVTIGDELDELDAMLAEHVKGYSTAKNDKRLQLDIEHTSNYYSPGKKAHKKSVDELMEGESQKEEEEKKVEAPFVPELRPKIKPLPGTSIGYNKIDTEFDIRGKMKAGGMERIGYDKMSEELAKVKIGPVAASANTSLAGKTEEPLTLNTKPRYHYQEKTKDPAPTRLIGRYQKPVNPGKNDQFGKEYIKRDIY